MLTTNLIRTLKPRPKRYIKTDSEGLYVEVLPTGRKAWRYRRQTSEGSLCKLTLGRWPHVTLPAARAIAAKLRAGQSLQEALGHGEESALVTVRAFGDRYAKEVLEVDRKDSSQLRQMLTRLVFPSIGNRIMSQVTGAEVRTLIFRKRDEGSPAAAAALRNLLKRMWDYAIVCGAAVSNPAHATPLKFIERSKSRSRTLSKNEIGRFLKTLYQSGQIAYQHKVAINIILLTLCRKSELRQATWAEVSGSGDEWEIPAEHSKTGKPHIVYLSKQAGVLFDLARPLNAEKSGSGHAHSGTRKLDPSEAIFPAANSRTQPMSPSTLNAALARVKFHMPHFTIHDLRRTAATLLSEAGYPADVIEKALNHTIKGVRGVYNRAEYGEQRKAMLQAWADMVDKWRAECER